jgi:hypothetical protein
MNETVGSWKKVMVEDISRRVMRFVAECDLSFTRLKWILENWDQTVIPFMRGDFDESLKGKLPPMPIKKHDDPEEWLEDRERRKPAGAP